MPRRRVFEQPTSKLAIWSRRFGLFALAVALLAIIIVRSGLLEIVPSVATLAGALVLAAMAILFGIAALVVIWYDGAEGLGQAFGGIGLGVALLAYPSYLAARAYNLPAINDVTTAPQDPPRFEVIARLRPREGSNPIEYAGFSVAELQRKAYPEIETLEVTVPPQAAFQAAVGVIAKRRWRVVLERSPLAGRRDGIIEAVALTPVMGFREDVVVRVRRDGEGSRIDIRSASRYGSHDLGANAARVRALLDDIDAAIDAQKPEPEKKPAPAKGASAKAGQAPARR
jgi:uncharacterized protein (DUF1499 family)